MIHYIKEGEEYVMVDEDFGLSGRTLWRGEEVSVAFSYDPNEERGIRGTLHKHGDPEFVNQWAETTRQKMKSAGLQDMMGEITVVTGKFDVDDLNRMISTTGYIGLWYEHQLRDGGKI